MMIWLYPEDLSRSVHHFHTDELGERVYDGYYPIWGDFPQKPNLWIDWDYAEENNTYPECPDCTLPLTPTGIYERDEEGEIITEAYICRYCEYWCEGKHITITPQQKNYTPATDTTPAPLPATNPSTDDTLQRLRSKYRYLLR